MFVGHYGPATAAAGGRIRLWHAFVAVQLLDILWAPFILLGIEHVRVVPGFTQANAFDLYDMPWTHSLPAALFWSLLAGGLYRVFRPAAGAGSAALISVLVFSHWIFDWLMHRPDLLLWFGGPKVGLGLWNDRVISISIEIAIYVAGFAVYWARTMSRHFLGAVLPPLMMSLGIAAQFYANFGPPPKSPSEAAISAIVAYALFIAFAIAADASRNPKRAA